MKKISCFLLISILSLSASAKDKKVIQDSHNSIYTSKIRRIVNAVNIGDYNNSDQYFQMLETACDRNKCSSLEQKTIQVVGQQIVACQIKHLKSHDIENIDAKNICESRQAQLGCDSLPTPLLRKMCYTGNQYSLKVWQENEGKIKSRNRMPASSKSK